MQPVVIGGVIIVPDVIRANLDGNGQISVQLPSTNDPDLNVTGWTYTVTEHMDNGRGPYEIEVPYSVTTLDLATVPHATPNPSVPSSTALYLTDVGVIVAAQSSVEGLGNLGGTGYGIAAHTGADTWSARTITSASGAALSIADGDGINGNPTFTVDATLVALAGQNWAANTIPVGTGADTAAQLSVPANTFAARSSAGDIAAKPITDFSLSLVDDVDATAARSTLAAVGSAELAAAEANKGADLVGLIQDGAGAVARTVTRKFNEYVSPLDFIPGGKAEEDAIRAGTSVIDHAPYIQTAIDRASSQGKAVILPAGIFNIGSTLSLPNRIIIRGSGWAVPFSGSVVQAPTGTVLKLMANANCDVFRQAAKTSRNSFHLSNFAINGDGANQGNNMGPDGTYSMYQFNRNAFFFEALYNTVFEDIFVYNMRGAGWALHGDGSVGMTNVFLRNCHAYNCRTYDVYCEGNITDLRISGGDYGFGRVANLRLTSSASIEGAVFWTSQCQDITDAATHATGTGAVVNGGIIIAGDNNRISGCRSEGNAGHGIRCVGNFNKASDCTLYFNSSTAGTSGLFDGVNDSGDDNTWEDLDIRQATSSAFALRKAIKLEAGHGNTRILGGDIRRIGANAAMVSLPAQGLSFSSGDRSDFSWASGLVEANNSSAHSVGTSFTVIQFNNEVMDTRAEYDAGTYTFTAAEAQIVEIEANVTINNATDGNSFITALHKNGASYRRQGQQRAGANLPIANGISHIVKLESGDTLDVRAICGTATNTSTGADITWLRIEQING